MVQREDIRLDHRDNRFCLNCHHPATHQFAQPDTDGHNTEQDGRVLCLHPSLRDRPDLIPLAVVYMIPVINYGDLLTDEHCRLYGATVLG